MIFLGKKRKNSKSFIELIRIRSPPTLTTYLDFNYIIREEKKRKLEWYF